MTAPAGGGHRLKREPGSFRDPLGFVFERDGEIYRQIHHAHADDWAFFIASGLHGRLVDRGWLVEHEGVPVELAFDDRAWRVIQPRRLDFISYPYEWTFSQLKDAALLTLDIELAALDAGMTLRDASAYNIQFERVRPLLIDAMSFERYRDGEPWLAYRQFCEHFLAPLALMATRDVRLGVLLRDFIDGIPLDLAARLSPARTKLRPGLAAHLHLHARAQRQHGDASNVRAAGVRLSADRLRALLASLRGAIDGLTWRPSGTTWAEYGTTSSYSQRAAASKRRLVDAMVRASDGDSVWDLGAGSGAFSELAAGLGKRVIAWDGDMAAAEHHYLRLRSTDRAVLPLVTDLTNPSPALGWAHRERRSLVERSNADLVLALALVHHLAIGGNVPLPEISRFLAALAAQLVIEFVPKTDPRVAAMLATRRDVFDDYSLAGAETAFADDWRLLEKVPIEDSVRVLLRFIRR